MANVFVNLPVPAGDGVGAWVDVSAQGPERTVVVDGGPFGGSIVIEGSNDAQASAVPAGAGLFIAAEQVPRTFLQAFNFLRVRRTASGSVGTPTVSVAAPPAIANVFGAMNVPVGDGVGASIDLSGGGDVNTFSVGGIVTGQVLIETSTDGVNFSPTLLFTTGGGVAQQVVGVLSAARVRRRGSSAGSLPLVAVGSQASGGGAGGAAAYVAPSLKPQLLTSVFWNGDSTGLGVGDTAPAGALLLNQGNNQTGGPRQSTLLLLYELGIPLPTVWFKGGVAATTPNMPTGQLANECHSGETAVAAAAAFPARWAANPSGFVICSYPINDVNNALAAGATPAAAAATGNAALNTYFTAVQATVPVGTNVFFYTPPGGSSNPGGTGTVRQALLLALPLFTATVAAFKAGGLNVWMADCTTGIEGDGVSGLFFDSLHPNAIGYLAVAGRVVNGLVADPY